MRVTIDRDRCAGHGLCYMVAPDVFTDDEDGYGRPVLDGELTGELVTGARRAAGSCPEQAIAITGDNTAFESVR
jgi:ferredoxin